jgi:glycosyltransferase involved in cell wall biosynthesis
VLLDAAALLPAGARVVMLGDGRAAGEVARRVREERLPVDLRGPGSRSDAAAVLRGATVATLPALWWENCPMAVLEAAAHGVPVVATRMGGIPELVEDGRTGRLVEPGDAPALAEALGSLLTDPARARALGAAGRARVARRHAPERYLGCLLDAYRAAIAAGSRTRSGPARRGRGDRR